VTLNLTNAAFQGASISIVATRHPVNGGDGLVNVGSIDASGRDLGRVFVDGDLGQIFAGSGADPARGLASLSVLSLGRFGMTTGAPGLAVNVDGRLGALSVKGDLVETLVIADSIGTVTIGGSLLGESGAHASITSAGNVGFVKIGGDAESGGISTPVVQSTAGKVAGVSIGGSFGGGVIKSAGDMGLVTVRANAAGVIESVSGKLAGVTVGGSYRDFFIRSGGDMGPVKIGGDLRADVTSGGRIASVTVGGGITDEGKDIVAAGDLGPVRIGGDVSNNIQTQGRLTSVTIGGSLIGLLNPDAAEIFSAGDMGPVKIGGDVIGSDAGTALIHTGGGKIVSVTIGGDLRGGSGADSGKIFTAGALGPVKIGGDVAGSLGTSSGVIDGGSIASVTIGGDLRGSSASLTGAIVSPGTIGAVKIGGDLLGVSDFGNSAVSIAKSGYIEGARIGSVFIAGSIISGTDGNPNAALIKNASIRAQNDIGAITVLGSIVGDASNPVVIAARGQITPGATTDVAIKSLTVGGRVERADILAGYDLSDIPVGVNADAQIGAVVVRDWMASNLVAGVQDDATPTRDDRFGEGDDVKIAGGSAQIVSKIASIVIKNAAFGTPRVSQGTGIDHFGFLAQQIGSLKVGATSFSLTPGGGNDLAGLFVGATSDLRVREVAI
jgi:hypothetical protein